MGHGADTDSSLPSTIDSSILSDDVDNIIPSRSITTAVRIVRKLSRDFFRASLLEHFGILLRRKMIRWHSRNGLPLSGNKGCQNCPEKKKKQKQNYEVLFLWSQYSPFYPIRTLHLLNY
jgi:hypothetical protein